MKAETSLSPSSIEETVRVIKTNGAKMAKSVPKTRIVKGTAQTKQVGFTLVAKMLKSFNMIFLFIQFHKHDKVLKLYRVFNVDFK